MVSALACSSDEKGEPCTRGAVECACTNEDQCDEGLVCDQGMCLGEGDVGLAVLNPNARGCEVLLEDNGSAVVSAEFHNGLQGTYVREAPKTAVTFIAGEDAPIVDGSVRVLFADHGAGAPAIQVVHCTDSAGSPIEGAKVELRD